MTQKEREVGLTALKSNPNWITNWGIWNGLWPVELKNVVIDKKNDLAIRRLDPFDNSFFKVYPKFLGSRSLEPGTSLCKLVILLIRLKPHTISSRGFVYSPRYRLLDPFPLEGIYTHTLRVERSHKNPGIKTTFIEMSTPSLPGQSGGRPILDRNGNIFGILSRGAIYPLHNEPVFDANGKEIDENHFFCAGCAV